MALRPVTGTFRPRKDAAPIPHEEGFRHALDNALKKTKWPAGLHEDIDVEFGVSVEVVNPGSIVEYRAKLRPPG